MASFMSLIPFYGHLDIEQSFYYKNAVLNNTYPIISLWQV